MLDSVRSSPVDHPRGPRSADDGRHPRVVVQLFGENEFALARASAHADYIGGYNGWRITRSTEHTGRELPDRPADAAGHWYRHSETGWSVIAWRQA